MKTNDYAKLAYLSGVLAGDGSIYTRPEKYDYIIKCVGNPKDEQEFYTEVVGPYFRNCFGFIPKIKLQDSGTTFGFVVYSKDIFQYLTKFVGLPNGKKYSNLRIPQLFAYNHEFMVNFIRGLFDTDGCVCFKKRYKDKPYYPVISLGSKSAVLIREVSCALKQLGFSVVETYDYKVKDSRLDGGFSVISRIELNGQNNFRRWLNIIGFLSPKHQAKIKKFRFE